MSDLVCLDGVTKSFKRGSEEIRAVDLIDLTLTDGEYVAIVGPSGSGKTTLLNMIGCIDKPSEGSVEIGGVRTDVLRDSELARVRASTFGFVFQQFFLMPTLTSIENVMVPGRFAVNKQKDLSERARSLLEMVGMSDRADHYPTELSGGEMQRVAIARALINKPLVLLADEPTGNLDSRKAKEVTELFDELNDAGLTIVVVTHNDELAKSCSRKIHIMDGKIVDDVVDKKPSRRKAATLKIMEEPEALPELSEVEVVAEAAMPGPEEIADEGGYLPTVAAPHKVNAIEMGAAVSVAGILALISTFLSWVPGATGYSFLTMMNYPGASYGGNFFLRTYTGSGAILLTGIWPMVIGIVILLSGIGMALKGRRAFTVAAVAGALGLIVSLLDIVMVFAKLRPAAGSGGMAPGAGLWLLAAASLLALCAGVWGAIHSNALLAEPSKASVLKRAVRADQ
jgi:putative ABC transport system ATP-binding protein